MPYLIYRYLLLLLVISLQVGAWLGGVGRFEFVGYVLAAATVGAYFVMDEMRARRRGAPATTKQSRERWRWRIYTYAAAFLAVFTASAGLEYFFARGTQPSEYQYTMFVLSAVMIGIGTVAYQVAFEKELQKPGGTTGNESAGSS